MDAAVEDWDEEPLNKDAYMLRARDAGAQRTCAGEVKRVGGEARVAAPFAVSLVAPSTRTRGSISW